MRIVIAGGPTREYVDPVRFISNASTGEFAFRIAECAKKKGHTVHLIMGPACLAKIRGIKCVDVETADEMVRAIKKVYKSSDCVVMAAAVCDFKAKRIAGGKIKKQSLWRPVFEKNIDIAACMSKWPGKKIRVGFALESGGLLANARKKMKDKAFDFIVANRISRKKSPFGSGKKNFLLIKSTGVVEKYTGKTKAEMAAVIIDNIERLW